MSPAADALQLGERILGLLEEGARSSTYKPALMLALLDRAPQHVEASAVPVRALAERVAELYWPQTLHYPHTETVLRQNQAGGQAVILQRLIAVREAHGLRGRRVPEALRTHPDWLELVDRVELTLAEWPIPRLQRPYPPFLYSFDWPFAEDGRWSQRAYAASSRTVELHPGVGEGLVALAPLLRPFVARWWSDKAAQLNKALPAAKSVLDFEDFLFGRDRAALARIGEGLLDLQGPRCFYCGAGVARQREVDHFIPWSHSGDDGLDNLVVACRPCNNGKRAQLATPDHLGALLERNATAQADLAGLAMERQWERDPGRTAAQVRISYLQGPADRLLWTPSTGLGGVPLGAVREELRALLVSA